MVIRAIKRLFGGNEGPGMSPEQAELRLKALKGQLVRNKGEAKRLHTEVERAKHLSPEQKTAHKARLKELEAQRKPILKEMKSLHKRLPKK
ncbi:MAG: hypothetical protein WDA16_12440 [Candidatus Thermoplasmatota archaeon]